MMTTKKNRRDISGFILLDKPYGMSSTSALTKIKYLFNAKKAGHMGTLDPLASGMLPIAFGRATKYSDFLLNAEKEYEVWAKLGERSSTQDGEGEIIETRPIPDNLSLEKLDELFDAFRGEITQVPSMFSALKHQGQPMYKFARQGVEIPRKERTVQIKEIKLLGLENSEDLILPLTRRFSGVDLSHKRRSEFPEAAKFLSPLPLLERSACKAGRVRGNLDILHFKVRCSKGTYIRSLVDDFGEHLGCGAYLINLRRTQVDLFPAEKMLSFEKLNEAKNNSENFEVLDHFILSPHLMFPGSPKIELSENAYLKFKQGQPFRIENTEKGWVQLWIGQDQFCGMVEIDENGQIIAKKLLF